MSLQHILTFAVLGVCFFLATVSLFNQDYSVMFAYITAGCSWIVVAAYEYNERAFSRAIVELLKNKDLHTDSDE